MAEKEYIEREALLSAAKEYDWIAGLKTVMKRIPAADVRPVVLCKDCKFYRAENKGKPWKAGRKYCVRSAAVATNPDGFCSRGERPSCGADMREES